MKKTRRCPKCDGIDLLYIADPFADPSNGDYQTGSGARLALVKIEGAGLFDASAKVVGTLEAYCCVNCGYVETYVKNWDGLQADGKSVVRLSPATGAYR